MNQKLGNEFQPNSEQSKKYLERMLLIIGKFQDVQPWFRQMWDIYLKYAVLDPKQKAPEQKAYVFKETGRFFVRMIADDLLIYPNEYNFTNQLLEFFFICYGLFGKNELRAELISAITVEIEKFLEETRSGVVRKKIVAAKDMLEKYGFSPN